ncbi:hypothetical protein TNIN_52591 [Trichonephila inaurata madagascariensis]|uniref:Uncharacterized protein n=1 Tax=Trichonephila inaurata madagascariensis TaxID=2747483 RepID=A0A8X7C2L3_9ARAC|nr:hypothetical protein TNIN_52591 [Trichonephila inaurata madagascariensis]
MEGRKRSRQDDGTYCFDNYGTDSDPMTKTTFVIEKNKEVDEAASESHGQEQPAPKPDLLRVPTERSNIPILASGKETSPSKPELVTKRTLTFPKYVSGQEKSSYDGSSVKRPRVTPKHFESGKSPSKREFSPVVKGRSKIPHLTSGQEQPASKPEHSRVRKGRSKIPHLAQKSPSKPELVPIHI